MTDVSVMLPRLAEVLREAAEIYNQTATRKLNVDGPSREDQTHRLDLTIEKLGFRFEDTGAGFVSVFEMNGSDPREWARVEPEVDRKGQIVAWREKLLLSRNGTSTRSLESLSQGYLLSLLRKRLLSNPTVS